MSDAAERTWSCLCGSFAGKVTGDPQLAVWCHCEQCRKFTGAAMQLAVFADDKIEVTRGDENVNKYQSKPGIFRNSCKTCGAFVYKTGGKDFNVVPLGAMKGAPMIKPSCHIFVSDKGDQDVMFPELPQHDAFP
mmetsp:Transcript_8677/g.19472  ORF Transcript_8677/g.19472 Transcript_8677/m.19472 type:complete len:134 (-) Transcript_8677:130-531(-)|eukprot:g11903.t1 g11903   contig6:826471-827069(-)